MYQRRIATEDAGDPREDRTDWPPPHAGPAQLTPNWNGRCWRDTRSRTNPSPPASREANACYLCRRREVIFKPAMGRSGRSPLEAEGRPPMMRVALYGRYSSDHQKIVPSPTSSAIASNGPRARAGRSRRAMRTRPSAAPPPSARLSTDAQGCQGEAVRGAARGRFLAALARQRRNGTSPSPVGPLGRPPHRRERRHRHGAQGATSCCPASRAS